MTEAKGGAGVPPSKSGQGEQGAAAGRVGPPRDGAGADAAADAALDRTARAVLDFWFGEPPASTYGKASARWFERDDAFDALIRERFGATLEAAQRGECDDWQGTPLGALALVIVLDQFSRNTRRGRADAFACDGKALEVARRLVAVGADRDLPTPAHRVFAYLPFEHAESLEAQRESVRLFEAHARETGETGKGSYVDYARRHAAVIERFGRFPHRNAVFGRASTEEEIAFLREPGSSF